MRVRRLEQQAHAVGAPAGQLPHGRRSRLLLARPQALLVIAQP